MKADLCRRALVAAALAMCVVGEARAAAPLVPVPGSPFEFASGRNSNVVALSPDERFVFVTNQWSDSVTVLAATGDGRLALVGSWATGREPVGIAVRPSGDVVYVAAAWSLEAHGVGPDGALTWRRSIPFQGRPLNGIVHMQLPGGEFVYALDNGWPNAVRRFAVQGDGTLAPAGALVLGEAGVSGGFAAPRLVAAGRKLFAMNGGYTWSGVTTMLVGDDGSLSLAPGGTQVIPGASGSLAVDPTGSWLYAGCGTGQLARFAVAAGGALAPAGVHDLGVYGSMAGMAVHPTGLFLVASFPYQRAFVTFDVAALAPAKDSPTPSDALAGYIGAMVFDRAGKRVVVGNGTAGITSVSEYAFAALPDLTATVEVSPETLNLRSRGKENSVTVFVEGAAVPDIAAYDPTQLTLTPPGGAPVAGTVHPAYGESDWNGNGVPDLLVKFDRQALEASILGAAQRGALDLAAPVPLALEAGGFPVGADTVRVLVR